MNKQQDDAIARKSAEWALNNIFVDDERTRALMLKYDISRVAAINRILMGGPGSRIAA